MTSLRLFLLIACCWLSISAHAVIESYEFKHSAEQQRFKVLLAELRCPKCQNQNLADSNSEIAGDLRAEVYRLINEGQSNDMIVDHLVARYGEFVRYRPPVDRHTVWLWFLPVGMLVMGLVVALVIARRSGSSTLVSDLKLSDDERKRLDEITRGQL